MKRTDKTLLKKRFLRDKTQISRCFGSQFPKRDKPETKREIRCDAA
jgi:hypothetical protein